MALKDFDGDTFVAFIDISGFKELMKQKDGAWKALDKFYQAAYNNLKRDNTRTGMVRVEGLFISDCGIMFVRGGNSNQEKLESILLVIKKINKELLNQDFMLSTSVAYGHFKYKERIEFLGIEKNPIYGSAYLAAYLDNADKKPTIQLGQCRIIIANLPSDVASWLNTNNGSLTRVIRQESKAHYYFYWNLDESEKISCFKKAYKNSYNLKYAGMLKALKDYGDISHV